MKEGTQLLYADPHAQAIVDLLPARVEKLGKATALCSIARPVPGFPCFSEEETTQYDDATGEWLVSTSWGKAQSVYGNVLGYELTAITPMYQLVHGNGNNVMPEGQMPVLGYAVIDPITGIVEVYTETDTEPVCHTTITSLEGHRYEQILLQVRVALAKAGVAVYPDELRSRPSLDYPWDGSESGYSATRVSNSEITVPLVGYALDQDSLELIYLHIVGVKNGIRSIWGTVNNGGQQGVGIVAEGQHHYAWSSHNYQTYSHVVDPETNLYRLMIVDGRAVDQEVEGAAYLIVPRAQTGEEEIDVNLVFAARLNALLPIPVLPEWGRVLFSYGLVEEEGNLLTPCLHGGDVARAFRIGDVDEWIEVIQALVQAGELEINIE